MIHFVQKLNSILLKHGIPPSVLSIIGFAFFMPLALSIAQAKHEPLIHIVLGCGGLSALCIGVVLSWYRRQRFPFLGEQDDDEQDDLSVDIVFTAKKPTLSDMHAMIDGTPTSELGFHHLSHLGIEQVDDYFGITSGGDVVVWFFPIINGEEVYHDPGPFDAIRIAYVVRAGRKDVFAKTLRAVASTCFTLALHKGVQIDLEDEAVIDKILTNA